MNKSTTIICGQETVDCTKIPVYILNGKQITTLYMFDCSDLYISIRKKILKNNKKFKHYYNEYDLPKFYFTYNGKPLFDSDVNIYQLNIHVYSYIHIHFIGLNGGARNFPFYYAQDINPYIEFRFLGEQYLISTPIQGRDSIKDVIFTFLEYLAIARRVDFHLSMFDSLFVRANLIGIGNNSILPAPPFMWDCTIEDIDACGRAGSRILIIQINMSGFNESCDSRQPLHAFRAMTISLRHELSSVSEEDSGLDDSFELQSGSTSSYNILSNLCAKTIGHNKEYVEKLIEDLLFLLNGIRRYYTSGGDKTLIIEYILIFLKLRNNKSLLSMIKNTGILDYVEEILKSDSLYVQTGTFHTLKDSLHKIKSIKGSETSKTLYRISMFALTLSLFDSVGLSLDRFGYSKFEQELLKRKYKFNTDVALDLAEGIVYLLEKGYQIILTKSLDPIFHSSSEYAKLYDTIIDLKQKQHALCNPEPFGFTESWYVKTLDDTIEKLKSVCKYAHELKSSESKVLKCHLNDLQLIKINKVIASAAQETREVPFSLLFFAQPGVGKSSLTKIVFQHFGATHGLETDECYLYTRNPVANFADGFSQRHWCWLADDIAFKKVGANPTGDPTTDELIQLINAVPYVPDQAAIENKGKIPAKPKLVLGTTNIQDMNAYHYFSCPSALQRRFPYVVTVSVKQCYQKDDGSGMLDSVKASCDPGLYPNYWILDVQKVKIPKKLSEMAKFESVLVTDDIDHFCSWLSKTSKQHFEEQKKMVDSLKEIKNIKICPSCYRNLNKCICSLQSGSLGSWIFHRVCIFVAWVCFYILKIIAYSFWEYYYIWFRDLIVFVLHKTYFENSARELERITFISHAERVKQKIGYPKLFGIILTTIVSSYTLVKLVAMLRGNFQGSKQDGEDQDVNLVTQSSEFKEPSPLKNERFNPWIITDYKLVNLDLTPPILSSKQFTKDEFLSMINNNIFSARIWDLDTPKEKWLNNIVCVKGNIYITNAHFFDKLTSTNDKFKMLIIFGEVTEGVSNKLEFILEKSKIKIMREQDLAMFIVPHAIPRKDITALFPKSSVSVRCSGTLLTRLPDGQMRHSEVNDVTIFHTTRSYDDTNFNHKLTLGNSLVLTQRGDCGSPLVLHSPKGHFIISIHRLGNSDHKVGGTCVFQEQLEQLFKLVDESYSTQLAPPNLRDDHMDIQTLHEKSVFNYIKGGSAEVYGSLGGFKRTYKSQVERSFMFPFLIKHGYVEKYTKPQLKGWKPWALAAEAMVNPITDFDLSIVYGVTKAYRSKIINSIPKNIIEYIVEKYDLFTSLNGAAGISYVDKINRNTSTGYPFYTTKRKFLSELPPERGLNEPVEIDDAIRERVDFIFDRYKKGLCYNPVFVASLKDEPVTFAKAELGKTRVFGSAPMDWTLVVRSYLLSSIRLIQNYKLIFETAVGTVAQSMEWGLIYKYLTKFGPERMVAGDFKNFDKKMSPVFIRQAFEVLLSLCEISGNYDEEDLRAIRCIAVDTAYPLMDFNNDLVKFFGSNPSGHSLTVIINSIVNSLYMRYVFTDLYYKNVGTASIEAIMDEFESNVQLLTYGDDNVLNISEKYPWYNHTSIAESFSCIGIEYTMADKSAESIPYIHIDEVSFLKRRWRFDEKLMDYAAPLEHDSIEKMLLTWVRSDTLGPREQCLAVVSSAIREYFFYGEEVYEEKRHLFQKLFCYLNISHLVDRTVLPTYNELVEQYKENSERVLKGDRFEIQTGPLYSYLNNHFSDDKMATIQAILIFLFIFLYFFLLAIMSARFAFAMLNIYLRRQILINIGRLLIIMLYDFIVRYIELLYRN